MNGRSQGGVPASLALGWLVSGPWPELHWTHFESRPREATRDNKIVFEFKGTQSQVSTGWHWVERPLAASKGHRLHVECSPIGAGALAIALVVPSEEKPPLLESTGPLLSSALHGADADHAEGEPRIARMGTDKKTSGLTPVAPSETIRGIRVIRGQNPSHPVDGTIRGGIASLVPLGFTMRLTDVSGEVVKEILA